MVLEVWYTIVFMESIAKWIGFALFFPHSAFTPFNGEDFCATLVDLSALILIKVAYRFYARRSRSLKYLGTSKQPEVSQGILDRIPALGSSVIFQHPFVIHVH